MKNKTFKDVKVGDILYGIDFGNLTVSKYIVTKITPIVEDDFIKYYVIKNNRENNDSIEDSFITNPSLTTVGYIDGYVFALTSEEAINELIDYKSKFIGWRDLKIKIYQKEIAKLKKEKQEMEGQIVNHAIEKKDLG